MLKYYHAANLLSRDWEGKTLRQKVGYALDSGCPTVRNTVAHICARSKSLWRARSYTQCGGFPFFDYDSVTVRHDRLQLSCPLHTLLDPHLRRVEKLLLLLDRCRVWSAQTDPYAFLIGGRMLVSNLNYTLHLANRLSFIRHLIYQWRHNPTMTSDYVFLHAL